MENCKPKTVDNQQAERSVGYRTGNIMTGGTLAKIPDPNNYGTIYRRLAAFNQTSRDVKVSYVTDLGTPGNFIVPTGENHEIYLIFSKIMGDSVKVSALDADPPGGEFVTINAST